jgi:V/A-type H+-transporting ATPase subunit F
MAKVIFITPEDARYGFTLAGAEQVVTAAPEVAATLQRSSADRGVGLIFLDERLCGQLDEEWLGNFEKHWPGLLIVLPAPEHLAAPAADYAMQLLAKAIGYQVRL